MNPDADETLDSHVQRGDTQPGRDERGSEPASIDDSFELSDASFAEPAESVDTSESIDQTRDSHLSPSAPTPLQSALDQTLDSADGKRSTNEQSQDEDDFSVSQPNADPHENQLESITASFAGAISRIGRYRTIRVLGEGAFGCVFEAQDPQLDRRVAIKVAKSVNSDVAIERFLREARSAAQLRHPNIIPVHEYGQVDSKHIIVYEYIEGETLKSYISRNHPLPLNESLRLVRKIAEGLDYAHSKGIIHRDMKPDNVMIDSSGQPHIADFGCARSIESDVSLTMDGSILGTPTYMSPEQASGKSNTADGRTDIWSLGVMLYEMVAGKRPFSGKLTDLLFWIRNHDPPPLRKVNPAAPIDIETLCTKCLQRELPDRFATAQELAEEIERFERGEPILSRPVTITRRLSLWRKRNPTVANLLAAVAITLIAGTTVSSHFALKALREENARIRSQVALICTAKATEVPALLSSLQSSKSTVLPMLKERYKAPEIELSDRRQLATALLYFETDDQKAKLSAALIPELLSAEADLLMVARNVISDPKRRVRDRQLWPVVLNEIEDGREIASAAQRLRAACLLSKLDPDDERWGIIAGDLSAMLVEMNLLESFQWLPGLEPIRDRLRPSLKTAFHATENLPTDRSDNSAALLARLFGDQPETLARLAESATPTQLLWLLKALETNQEVAREQLTVRLEELESSAETQQRVIARANLIIAMIQMGSRDHWVHLDRQTNVSVATEIIERLGPSAGLNTSAVEYLSSQLSSEQPVAPGQIASLILSMGQFSKSQIPDSRRKSMIPLLLDVFINHPDAEVHASARWLLQSWGAKSQLASAELKLRSAEPNPGHRWHVDLAGNTFVIFEPIDQFLMGTTEPNREKAKGQSSYTDGEQRHLRRIPRRFGICMHESTGRQFEAFETYMVDVWRQKMATLDSENQTEAKQLKAWIADISRRQKRRSEYSPDAPIVEVSWIRALAYCRWLSDEYSTGHCLPPVARLQQQYDKKTDVPLLQKHIQRPGYRLPTAAEWEYACRANTSTLRPTGTALSRLKSYAWYGADRNFMPRSVGTLKPNGFGMFDMLGNASEWCLTWFQESLPDKTLAISGELVSSEQSDPIWPDIGKTQTGWQSLSREYRGASFQDNAGDVRTSKRFYSRPFNGHAYLGFRLARTYELDPDEE